MSSPANGLRETFWDSIRPDIFAQYRDALITANLLLIIGIIQVVFLVLDALHVDAELLTILHFIHKWATVGVFGSFMFTVLFRSFVVVSNTVKKK